jgi:Tfp pilus assembly protein FimT
MSHGRSGHTFLELIAVIAVLVAVAAISIPMVKPMLQAREKEAAADMVRARWTQLRSKAINTGRAYSFEFKPDTGRFRMVPEEKFEEGDEEFAALSAESELPGDIPFTDSGVADPGSGSDGWTRAATFNPDGTAKQDASVTIGRGTQAITLKLNGATGAVSAAEGNRP